MCSCGLLKTTIGKSSSVTSPVVKRLTFNKTFDGFPSLSPDGKKMLFTRSHGGFMSNLYTYVMDVSSLNIGPDQWMGEVPAITPPEDAETEAEQVAAR